jgi:hypothetical protein
MQVTIAAETQDALDRLQRLGLAVRNPRGFTQVATEGAKYETQENFRQLNLSRHRANAPRPGFYATARESTISKVETTSRGSISVTGPRGIQQRIHGGTITAKPGKYLAIPVHPRVTGIRAREVYERLGLMTVVNRSTGKGVLVDANNVVFYALTRSVTQKADPSVLPSDARLRSASLQAAIEYADSLTN